MLGFRGGKRIEAPMTGRLLPSPRKAQSTLLPVRHADGSWRRRHPKEYRNAQGARLDTNFRPQNYGAVGKTLLATTLTKPKCGYLAAKRS
jgi:hypothetical protein